MGKPKNVDEAILDAEKTLQIFNFVKSKVPDAKVHFTTYYNGFSAKSVNSSYTNFDFIKGYNVLFVVPFLELNFEYNGACEKIKINSSPRSSRLVNIYFDQLSKNRVISFSRLSINLKNNNFKGEMINECRIKILEFIKEHPGCGLDTKHLEPRLKKLLLFT